MKTILWRLHTASPPERLWELLTTDAGRARFWAETSRSDGDRFTLGFSMGLEGECRVIEAAPPVAGRLHLFRDRGADRARA